VISCVSVPCFADDKDTCADAHVAGQTARRDGQLLEAKSRFSACAAESCPDLVKKDCTSWAAELASSIPSIVIRAMDEDGRDLSAVTLLIDGRKKGQRLDGRAIELDPGEHLIAVELPNGKKRQLVVVLREGERARQVTLEFPRRAAPKAEPAPPQAEPPSVLPFVFGGVAVAAFGSFATFAFLGKQKQDELDECRPDCDQSDVDSMRMRYAIGDISLAVGAIATGFTLYFALAPSDSKRERAFVAPRVGPNSAGLTAGARF
jgi:hypothetical protein